MTGGERINASPELSTPFYRDQRMWNDLAALDPMWTILSVPDKIGNRWDDVEFFATGEREIASVIEFLESSNIAVSFDRVLDFGCGIGRLTRALAHRSSACVGFDISATMIAAAAERNRDLENCDWVVNNTDDLKPFESDSFSFIYSNITLQHLAPSDAVRYIGELVRVLRPQGCLVFQLPDAKPHTLRRALAESIVPLAFVLPRPWLNAYRRARYPAHAQATLARLPRRVAQMHGIAPAKIHAAVKASGANVVATRETADAGAGWRSYLYCVRKAPEERASS